MSNGRRRPVSAFGTIYLVFTTQRRGGKKESRIYHGVEEEDTEGKKAQDSSFVVVEDSEPFGAVG
jgi:hypothetical protein